MFRTRSKSVWISVPEGQGWGTSLAERIDRAIHTAGADRDVISVAVAPVASLGEFGSSPTRGVTVTVVWREAAPPLA